MVRASHMAAILAVVLAFAAHPAAAGRYCICPKTAKQVCGVDSQTYANACVAACMKVQIRFKSACPDSCSGNPTKTCICGSAPFSPYCLNGLTYASECTAKCAGMPASCGYPDICKYPGSKIRSYATPPGAANGFRYNGGGFPSRKAARHNYWKALDLNYRFYESMRSGRLPKNKRISWRGNSCLKCRGKYGEDLSGGYYEAGGSYLKMTQIIAYTTTMLGWAADIGMSGLAKAGQKGISLDAIYWGAYYLVRGHVAPNKMVAQLGHRCTDFRYFGPPEYYEQHVKKVFPAENPKSSRDVGYVDCGDSKGSEIAAMSAAALAMGAKVFRAHKYRVKYARIMESHAKQLYNMAKNCQGSFANAKDKVVAQNHAKLYGSDGYKDDLAFAAAVMYLRFKDPKYLNDARRFYAEVPAEQPSYANGYPGYHFDGKFMYPAVHVLMARIDPNAGPYIQKANAFLDQYINGGIPRTSRGLPYPFAWGALRVSANTAFLALLHANNAKLDAGSRAKYFQYGEWIINYILGDAGRSYLIGYGSGNPKWTWHKFSTFPYNKPQPDLRLNRIFSYKLGPWTQRESCNVKDGQAYLASEAEFLFRSHTKPHAVQPVGALYGAPLQNDNIIFGRDYSYAEPTIDGNAGLTGALAILATHFQP